MLVDKSFQSCLNIREVWTNLTLYYLATLPAARNRLNTALSEL